VRERVPASDTGAVIRGLVSGYLADREAGEPLQAWLRRQPPETLAAISKPEGSGRRAAPVGRAPVGSP
jgi:hypothetical protein